MTKNSALNNKLKISSKIIWKDIDNKIYILQPERREIHSLNETASFIWRLLAKNYDLKTIIKKLQGTYDVRPQVAKRDLLDFVNKFIREKFLTIN